MPIQDIEMAKNEGDNNLLAFHNTWFTPLTISILFCAHEGATIHWDEYYEKVY